MDSQETRGSFKTTRAAMFGLDARIALAIFGALSVISGAALYSAIQQATVVYLTSQLNEVSKAIEEFMLDTGQDLSINSTSFFYGDLVDDNSGTILNWNGPYISIPGTLSGTDSRLYLNEQRYGNLILRTLPSNIGGSTATSPCSSLPCYYWIQLNGVPNELVKTVDRYIDGTDSVDSGKVRISDSDINSIFLQGPLMLSQP